MTDARETWKDLADRVESLGLKLKLHLEQEQDDAVAVRAEGDTANAFERLAHQVTEAFDSFGNAAKDQAVKSDVREIAELIKQALMQTFHAVGAELGGLMEQIEEYAEDAAEKLARSTSDDDDDDDGDDDAAGGPITPASGQQDDVSR